MQIQNNIQQTVRLQKWCMCLVIDPTVFLQHSDVFLVYKKTLPENVEKLRIF